MKLFSIRYFAIVSCSLLLSCTKTVIVSKTLSEAIDNIVTPYTVLGADVGVIVGTVKDGKATIYSYGEKKPGSHEKITAQSVLEIASLTKTYTALALAAMCKNGELNLDDPIENYLPGTVKVPSFNGKKITLRHLANHTSGLPRLPDNIDKEAYNPYKGYTKEKMYEFLNGYSLTREPGSEWEYSNVGFGLLGEILSLKNSSNYETMITDRVLQPLGMTHTTVSFTAGQLLNLVQGYNGNKQVESWSQYQQNIFQGTGSLTSSMEDQLIFLQANMGLIHSSLDSAILLSHQSSTNNPDDIGLAWNKKTMDNLHIIHKNGGNGGYGSFMGFDKMQKIGVVVMVNSSLNPELFPTDMGFEILKALNKFQ
ncbi:MAG: serine hydrolase domain-containing protein [Ferruginibacter sp.]